MGDDPKGALADLDRALALDPHSLPALQNRAHVLAERLGRQADAIAALDRALAVRRDPELEAARGVCLARLGRRGDALAAVRRCLARPAGAGALYRVGCVYALTSAKHPADRADALFYLERAVRLGFDRKVLAHDRDLVALRTSPSFRSLLADPSPGESP
jgi:tetratricopeptide (TPR) repeat protein